jgi:CBS domain-containing protein
MNVGRICKHQVVTVAPQTELVVAAQLMREKHIGYLVVVESGPDVARAVGVLTDRDIVVSIVARGADPKLLTVGDVMSREPVTVNEKQSIAEAVRTMRRMGVRRLPVVGSRGEVIGMLSLDDVIDVVASEIGDLAGAIHNEQRIEGVLRS